MSQKLFVGTKPKSQDTLDETVLLEFPSAEEMQMDEEEWLEMRKQLAYSFLLKGKHVFIPDQKLPVAMAKTEEEEVQAWRNLAQTTRSTIHF